MAHPTLDLLFDELLAISKKHLEKYGEFYPCAGIVTDSGQFESVVVHTGDEHPKSKILIEEFNSIFREEAKNKHAQAMGISFDVHLTKPNDNSQTDAIQFNLEHENLESISVFVPYKKSDKNSVEYGEIFSDKKDRIWY